MSKHILVCLPISAEQRARIETVQGFAYRFTTPDTATAEDALWADAVLGPAVAADDDAVHRVVQLLQKLAGHDRQRKEQYLLPLRADGHISPVQVLTPLIS